jgi:hypothetical protein
MLCYAMLCYANTFLEELANKYWDIIYEILDVDMWICLYVDMFVDMFANLLEDYITETLDRHAPLKMVLQE